MFLSLKPHNLKYMNVAYSIDANDYLTFQLFTASKSDIVKKRRLKSKLIFSLLYLAIGIFFLVEGKINFTVAFVVLGIVWYFVYPMREKRMYEGNYRNYITKHFYNRFGKPATLEIDNHYIVSKDEVSTGKISTKDIESISEIPTAVYIKFNTGQSFILPKDKIENLDEMILKLKELADLNHFSYYKEMNWKWK